MSDAEEDQREASDDPAVDPVIAELAAVDEGLAAEVSDRLDRTDRLERELEEREAAIEDLESRLKRARADLRNYKQRTEDRLEDVKDRATEDLVERLLDVRDNLVRAVEQDADVEVRDGVEATLSTFDRILADENVAAIEPDPGESVDPQRHEVLARVESDRPSGAIDEVYRPGYEMAGKVVRPAQVTVSEGSSEAGEADETADSSAGEPADR